MAGVWFPKRLLSSGMGIMALFLNTSLPLFGGYNRICPFPGAISDHIDGAKPREVDENGRCRRRRFHRRSALCVWGFGKDNAVIWRPVFSDKLFRMVFSAARFSGQHRGTRRFTDIFVGHDG